jgi:hypothetical protein
VIGGRTCRDAVQDGIGVVAERADGINLWIHPMSPFMREQGVGETLTTLNQETSVGRAEGFIHSMEREKIRIRWPVSFCHQGCEKTLPPRSSKGISKSCFRGVKQVDPVARDGPHKCSVDFDGEEGKSLAHPIEDGHAAIGGAGKDATESQEFGRKEAVTVSCLADSIGPAEPSLTGYAVDAPRVSQERWVGVRAQEGR